MASDNNGLILQSSTSLCNGQHGLILSPPTLFCIGQQRTYTAALPLYFAADNNGLMLRPPLFLQRTTTDSHLFGIGQQRTYTAVLHFALQRTTRTYTAALPLYFASDNNGLTLQFPLFCIGQQRTYTAVPLVLHRTTTDLYCRPQYIMHGVRRHSPPM